MIDDINEEVDTETTDTNTGAEDTSTPTTPGLGINDLRIFKQIIDICTSRGAFKAEEFTSIGESYDKLASLLGMIDAQAQAEAEAEAEAGEDETADSDTDETASAETEEETEA